MAKGGWVYIMTNRPNGTLYVGTTANPCATCLGTPERRGRQLHKTIRSGPSRLCDDILQAKQRERNIKHWRRAWKIQLILKENPNWDDLYDCLV